MSKYSDKLVSLISDFEDKTLDRDTTAQTRTWAANWLVVDKTIQMLQSDAIRTNFPEEHYLPEMLETDVRDQLDKMSKTAFPASKELSELNAQIAAMLAVTDDSEVRDDLEVTDEIIQRAHAATIAYKKGQPAQEARFGTTPAQRQQAAETDKMRNLDGRIKVTHTAPDGTINHFFRTGNWNGLSYAIKTIVDKSSDLNNVDKVSAWGQTKTELANFANEIKAANESRIAVNGTFEDIHGNVFEVAFPA